MHWNKHEEKSKKKQIAETLALIWKYSAKKRKYLYIVLLFAIFAIGFNLFTLYLMGDMMGIFMGMIFKQSHEHMKFIYTICIMAGSYAFQYIFNLIQSRLLVDVSQGIGYFLRQDLFRKLQRLSSNFIDSQSTGNLMSVFTNDIDVLVSSFSQSINALITSVLTVVGGILLMLLINPVLASASLGISFILFCFVSLFIKKSQPHFAKQQKLLGDVSSKIQEYNFAHDMVTLYGYQDKVVDLFEDSNQELKKATNKAQLISGLIFPYNNFINNFVIAVANVLVFIILIYKAELLDIAAVEMAPTSIIVIFVMALRQTTTQIATILSQVNALQLTFAAASRVQSIFNVEDEANAGRTTKLKVTKAKIEFKDVTFSYVPNKPVLKNISFIAEPGTMNAIVGPTGSGKTTITNLLTAFYDIDSGSILVDGKDLAKCRRDSIRDNVALVIQDSFMFNGTIMENIRYGRRSATDEEVIKAAKASNAHKFISRLPDGYKTVISNSTGLLSEGEKQLISIARIFLSKAKILILDEATSYVDTKTEKDIQAATRRLMKNRTSIVIAHRLSTIKDADNILVIKDGVKIESGNHADLMKQKGFYHKMNTALDGDFDTEANR